MRKGLAVLLGLFWVFQAAAQDVTSILAQEKPNPAKIAELKAKLAEVPAPSLEDYQLAKFYFEQGLAAAELGLTQQRLTAFLKAVEISRQYKVGDLSRYLMELGKAERFSGNIRKGREAINEAIKILEEGSQSKGRLFAVYGSNVFVEAHYGDLREAKKWLIKLEDLLKEAQNWRRGQAIALYGGDWYGQVFYSRGIIAAYEGRLGEAEKSVKEAIKFIAQAEEASSRYEHPPPPGTYDLWRAGAQMELARILRDQNRLFEAENYARKALLSQLKRRGRDAPETANAIRSLAGIIAEAGKHKEAEKLIRTAIEIYQQTGQGKDSVILAQSFVQLAGLLMSQGRFEAALKEYRDVIKDLETHNPTYIESLIRRNLSYGLVLLRTGNAALAIDEFSQTVRIREQSLGPMQQSTLEARGMLALALSGAGRKDEALNIFAEVVPLLLGPKGQALDNDNKSARFKRLRMIVDGYLALLGSYNSSRESQALGFKLAVFLQGQTVSQAINATSARNASRDPLLAALTRKEQDTRLALGSLRQILLSQLGESERDETLIADVKGEINQKEQELGQLQEKIAQEFPAYAELLNPPPLGINDVGKILKPGEIMILCHIGTKELFLWAISSNNEWEFAVSSLEKGEIDKLVSEIRQGLDKEIDNVDKITPFAFAASHKLYQGIIAPLGNSLNQAQHLIIAANGSLGKLPFALLTASSFQPAKDKLKFANYRKADWLIRRFALSSLPSPQSLVALRSTLPHTAPDQPFIGFADPIFSREQLGTQIASLNPEISQRKLRNAQEIDQAQFALLPRLEETAQEIAEIAKTLGAEDGSVFTGLAANEKRVREENLSRAKVLMFATHGLKAGDIPGLNEPALALSAPDLAGVEGDGLLTASEITALQLNADWVILSACNTAAGESEGAEALSGLGRSFFHAGARAILSSHWPVESSSAQKLTTGIFRQAKQGRAQALRASILDLMDKEILMDEKGGAYASYAHPVFFAPFTLVGDGDM